MVSHEDSWLPRKCVHVMRRCTSHKEPLAHIVLADLVHLPPHLHSNIDLGFFMYLFTHHDDILAFLVNLVHPSVPNPVEKSI